MRLNKLDILFSELIRRRAILRTGGCERCLSWKVSYKLLQCSHYWGRNKKSVRYDEDNAAGLCPGCHMHLTSHPAEHVQWFEEHLGPDKFNMLQGRMRIKGKPDEQILLMYYQNMLKALKDE